VGNRPDSTAFIRAKKAFAKRVGVNEKHIQVPENISQNELIDIIKKCNIDLSIHGIIIQLPLPIHIGRDTVIDAIDPKKDADGLTATNVKLWLEGREDCIMPATARGIKHLLNYYKIDLFGKHVTVVGRSMLVGKPIVAMCLNENATVTVGHSKTKHLAEETKNADVLVVAVGKPGLIDEKYVKKGQVVIDVGISRTQDNKLIGDVDFNSVSKKVSAITPVPGGVGPMTVFSLFENLIGLCEKW
jgi:methylenetetrahydrofolate dehydrogenase (NADP+) / methenyltetrahydrofolate cyclohydrolase